MRQLYVFYLLSMRYSNVMNHQIKFPFSHLFPLPVRSWGLAVGYWVCALGESVSGPRVRALRSRPFHVFYGLSVMCARASTPYNMQRGRLCSIVRQCGP